MTRYTYVDSYGGNVGFFSISPVPGNAEVCVIHDVCLNKNLRGRGLAAKFMRHRLHLAKTLGYKMILATVVETNLPQIKTMEKFGWTKVDPSIESERTGNRFNLWVYD